MSTLAYEFEFLKRGPEIGVLFILSLSNIVH